MRHGKKAKTKGKARKSKSVKRDAGNVGLKQRWGFTPVTARTRRRDVDRESAKLKREADARGRARARASGEGSRITLLGGGQEARSL